MLRTPAPPHTQMAPTSPPHHLTTSPLSRDTPLLTHKLTSRRHQHFPTLVRIFCQLRNPLILASRLCLKLINRCSFHPLRPGSTSQVVLVPSPHLIVCVVARWRSCWASELLSSATKQIWSLAACHEEGRVTSQGYSWDLQIWSLVDPIS